MTKISEAKYTRPVDAMVKRSFATVEVLYLYNKILNNNIRYLGWI